MFASGTYCNKAVATSEQNVKVLFAREGKGLTLTIIEVFGCIAH